MIDLGIQKINNSRPCLEGIHSPIGEENNDKWKITVQEISITGKEKQKTEMQMAIELFSE